MWSRRRLLSAGAGLSAAALMPGQVGAQANADGWFVLDEAHRHQRTFMQWPASRRVYSDSWFRGQIQDSIATLANAISAFEPVTLLAAAEHHGRIRAKVSGRVELWDIPTEDLWARDSGPLFVTDGRGNLAVRNFNFNGWGNKQVHRLDGQVATRVAQRLGLPLLDSGLVGEPGGAEYDGEGTLIAHEASWINRNRNRGSKAQIERLLAQAYGAEKVIWAPGLRGQDITDDHIDSFARFTAPGRLLVQLPSDAADYDRWWRRAEESLAIFEGATDARGRRLQVDVIQDPWDTRVQSQDFVAAYVNYYVCNGAVIMAQFGDRGPDQAAQAAIRRRYPGRELVVLNMDAIGEVGGGIHCATQQMPLA